MEFELEFTLNSKNQYLCVVYAGIIVIRTHIDNDLQALINRVTPLYGICTVVKGLREFNKQMRGK